ncbi:MAG: hypothetical protein GY792_36910 [Gammaproteobacteria bacterium]|nr:hypothetical protein [Gammaproteobacteria bacterium]
MQGIYPISPSITLFDPLAELLGAGDGRFHYTFDDVVKLSGHACPTVAGAFLIARHAVRHLYADEVPERGAISVTLPGAQQQGVNGPISQVFTLITGAAAGNGFHGLGGQFSRSGLMQFGNRTDNAFHFDRTDRRGGVLLSYDPSPIPADPAMGALLQRILQGDRDSQTRQRFSEMWRSRVIAILEDGGERTITRISE